MVYKKYKNYFVFIDESGVLDESRDVQPFFGVGFFKISDTSLITESLYKEHYDYFSQQREKRRVSLKTLREKPRVLKFDELNLLFATSKHNEYKFTKITYTTIEKYKSLLDTALQFPFYFCAIIIDKTDPKFNSLIYKNYWDAYISYTKLLISRNILPNETACIVADYMSRPSNSNKLFEREINSLNRVCNTIRAHSESFILLQLTDLLLGAVMFQWRRKIGNIDGKSNRAKAKDDFSNYLNRKLDIPNNKNSTFPLAQNITIQKPFYFSVWQLKLSKIKNGGV